MFRASSKRKCKNLSGTVNKLLELPQTVKKFYNTRKFFVYSPK